MTKTCGHCGNPQRGMAAVNGTPLCHPDSGPDCYRLVTVYHHPTPCPDCPGRRDLESFKAFEDRLDAVFNAIGPPPGWTPAAMFAAPQIRSEYGAACVGIRDATGREYRAVTVDGELTYQPTDTEETP